MGTSRVNEYGRGTISLPPDKGIGAMKTVLDFFQHEVRSNGLVIGGTKGIRITSPEGRKETLILRTKLFYDEYSGTSFYSVFIPKHPLAVNIAFDVISHLKDVMLTTQIHYKLERIGRQLVDTKDLKFSGSLLLYTEEQFAEEAVLQLVALAKVRELKLSYCGPRDAQARYEAARPLAFISHDNRDKKRYASKVAEGLVAAGVKVWYDEYSLKVGDSLRESIERGLKECKHCVLLLSKNFISNPGWTKIEFNAVFTRELMEKKNLILPVWLDVTSEEVFGYCPELKNRVAASWKDGKKKLVSALLRGLQS